LQQDRTPTVIKTSIRADALAPADPARAAAILARIGAPGELPKWPAAEVQTRYTGVHGLESMRSALRFVETLERAGALARLGWRGLDYGCGWGRMASVMLTKGSPEQLDLCDAWPRTMAILDEAGFPNRTFPVSEILAPGEIPDGAYDFVYAYSVFTHLRRDVFEHNLALLLKGLRPGGRLYATVRHADYLPRAKARPEDHRTLARDGFWYRPTGNSAFFGMAVVERSWLEALPIPSLDYLGEVDPCQHLYAIGG
jgi:hypothetical protein